MFKVTILVLFLCCHLHLSYAKTDVGKNVVKTGILSSIFGGATKAAEKAGDKIGSKTVHTGILTGISTAATKAAEKAARPFYKFFIEGGTGFVTRYFTLNDYFGIGKTIRKGLVATASSVGSGAWSVGKVVKKYADKKMQDQAEEMAEEMNKWWMKQKDAAMDSIKSGIKGGITAVASAAIGARKRSNKRKSRSVDGEGVDPLVAVFENIAREDPQQCLPLLICAIHADPQGLLTPQETKLVTVFRPLVIHRHVPEWAGPWVRGARQGVSVSHEKVEVGNTNCRKEFPNCPFSAHYLRSQMSETYDVTPQKDESRKDIHLELNMIES